MTCYHWRWGIEVAFRYLKHANGLLYFHSKKPEFLKQEIYGNLILYNFGIFLANEAAEENQKKKREKGNKYNYEIDFSSALKTARKFFIRNEYSCAVTPPVRQTGNRLSRPTETACASLLA